MSNNQKPNKSSRRSMLERVEEIFIFIDNQDQPFPKSKLQEIGLNPTSAENWLTLIEFIQNQPRIRLISSEKNLLVEKIEGKYQAMIRRVIADESIPFEEREILLKNYLPSLYTRERLEIDRKHPVKGLNFPKTKDELVKFVNDNNIQISDINNLEELLIVVKRWFIDNDLL